MARRADDTPQVGVEPGDEVHFFAAPEELRSWLAEHHATAGELWVGLYKAGNPEPTLTWSEIVDEALCVGWIDGRGQRIDDRRWKIRLTPRRPGSIWSKVNVDKVAALTAEGRMQPAGRAVFEARGAEHAEGYSVEQQRVVVLDPAFEAALRADPAAATFFYDTSPPSYRRAATWWVMSAKKDETRRRRLATLITDSARGERVAPLRRR